MRAFSDGLLRWFRESSIGNMLTDLITYLGMMRLERRRVRSDLIETFKITKGMYDINKEVFFELDDSGRRGHEQKLFKNRFRLDIRKSVFSNRVVNDWNSLSSQCVNTF